MGKRNVSNRNLTLTTGTTKSGIIEVNGVNAHEIPNRKRKECRADGTRNEGTTETITQGMSIIIINTIIRGLRDDMKIGY